METLELLRRMRVTFRNQYLQQYRDRSEPFMWGIYIKVTESTYQEVHQEMVDYFRSRGFDIKNENAPSPSGEDNEGFQVFITSVCSDEGYHKMVGISVSIHHDAERAIPRDERPNYCY